MLSLFLCDAASIQAQPPAADEILRASRENSSRQDATLRARLRDEDGNKIPFTISMSRGVVNFDFENPDQRIQLVISADDAGLREGVGNKTKEVRPARYDQKLRGTPISYEDLAMRPLYWTHGKFLGEETILGRKTWIVEVPAPAGGSQYGAARLWIDQQSGGALQIKAYSKEGKIVKLFKATAVAPIKGRWTLKTMRIQSYDPATQKPLDLTYLDILGEAS